MSIQEFQQLKLFASIDQTEQGREPGVAYHPDTSTEARVQKTGAQAILPTQSFEANLGYGSILV